MDTIELERHFLISGYAIDNFRPNPYIPMAQIISFRGFPSHEDCLRLTGMDRILAISEVPSRDWNKK